MVKERPHYNDRRRVHQRALPLRLPRGGSNTRLWDRLMAGAAEEKYHTDPDVPKVDYSTVLARRAASQPLNSIEVRDMHSMLERVFLPQLDGYAYDLSGFRRQFWNFLASSSTHSAVPASPPTVPSR